MFRSLIILTSILVLSTGCKNDKKSDLPVDAINSSVVDNPVTVSSSKNGSDKVPVFEFESSIHDFGSLIEGEKISFAFRI